MSLFAILQSEQGPRPTVVDCHLNVWSLGGLLGYRPTIFDVGLRLEAPENHPVSEFQLAIPFGTHEKGLIDLQEKLTIKENLNLVFAGNATLNTEGATTIKYGTDALILAHIDINSSQRLSRFSDEQISVWKIRLAGPVVNGAPIYVRLRFHVDSLGRTWTWRHSAFAKNGALIDFRVGDARSTRALDRSIDPKHILTIENLNVFIVAPAWLTLRTASPDLHYIRLLEGRPWWNYLGLATNLLRDEKLVIYQWRKADVAWGNKSFHTFLDLSRHSPLTLASLARISLILLSLGGLVWLFVVNSEQIIQFVTNHLVKLGFIGAMIGLYKVFRHRNVLRNFRCRIRNGFQLTVKYILKVRAAMGS